MYVTLNIEPELEAGIVAQARVAGLSVEDYLLRLVAKEVPLSPADASVPEGSGMVMENGLLIYGAGTALPAGVIDHALRRSREERSQNLLGRRS